MFNTQPRRVKDPNLKVATESLVSPEIDQLLTEDSALESEQLPELTEDQRLTLRSEIRLLELSSLKK